jgi:predicted permease
MVALVLVIACGNVAMMLGSRNTARRREFSVRLAMGGSRGRLFRQLLTESLLLVAAGSALGWFLATAATRALSVWSELNQNLDPDRTVLFFTLGISLVVALLFGLAPLRNAIRVPIGLTLKTSAATSHTDQGGVRGRKIVMGFQVAVSVVLLVAAGLLLRTLQNLQSANLGMRIDGLLVFGINPEQKANTDAETIRFYEDLLNRLRTVPGIESATLMQNRLGAGWSNNTTPYIDGQIAVGGENSTMRWNAVGPSYFATLGTNLIYGRDFTEADSATAQKVAIISEAFAKRFLKNQNPIGRHLAMGRGANAPQFTIVGVSADSKYTGVSEEGSAIAYFPYKQIGNVGTMHVELRTQGDPKAMLPAIQRIVREYAPDLPLLSPMTQRAQFDSSFSTQQLIARLSIFFGLLAALLMATGLYGSLAYTVNRRTAELGLRMALGAQRNQVLWMVLKESLVVSAVGGALGLPLALACSRLLSSLLYGVVPGDPLSIAGALAGVAVVALGASFIPARRAASTDPMRALRYE